MEIWDTHDLGASYGYPDGAERAPETARFPKREDRGVLTPRLGECRTPCFAEGVVAAAKSCGLLDLGNQHSQTKTRLG